MKKPSAYRRLLQSYSNLAGRVAPVGLLLLGTGSGFFRRVLRLLGVLEAAAFLWSAAFLLLLPFANELYAWLARPLLETLPEEQRPAFQALPSVDWPG